MFIFVLRLDRGAKASVGFYVWWRTYPAVQPVYIGFLFPAWRVAAFALDKPLICTIGHSTLPIDTFIDLLRGNGIGRVLDVRTVPRSRHNPQFNLDTLPASLEAAGIAYAHVPALGGLRHARPDSPNTGWHNLSFRGYADYMQSPAFTTAVEEVAALAPVERCVLMCAEAVPWRCHRSMIGDALLVRGIGVEDIIGKSRKPHVLTKFARVEGVNITYPPPADK